MKYCHGHQMPLLGDISSEFMYSFWVWLLHHRGFFLQKTNKVLHKALRAMTSKSTIQQNKLMQLENSILMYGIYNVETLEKLIITVHNIHNTTSSHERLFARQEGSLTLKSLYAPLLHKFSFIFKNYSG